MKWDQKNSNPQMKAMRQGEREPKCESKHMQCKLNEGGLSHDGDGTGTGSNNNAYGERNHTANGS